MWQALEHGLLGAFRGATQGWEGQCWSAAAPCPWGRGVKCGHRGRSPESLELPVVGVGSVPAEHKICEKYSADTPTWV